MRGNKYKKKYSGDIETMKNPVRKAVPAFQGSFTVEASLLLPMIIFLIFNLLFLSFFLYDQCTILQGCYCTALCTERAIGTEEEKNAVALEKYKWSVRKKAVAANISEDINVQNGSVTVETMFSMKAPGRYFFQSIWNGRQKQTADQWEPVTFIRKCRKAETIGNIIQTGK